jgi:diguanylate cyclase (GGDEF)-like protein
VNDANRGARRRTVTGWAVWRLPPALRWYVCGLTAAAVAAAGRAAAVTSWRLRDLVLCAVLTCFGAAVVELTRRAAGPEPAGHMKEVYAAWLLPVAFLLPAVYSLAAPAFTIALLQLRIRRTIVHRRVFSAGASGLTLAAVSVAFHALPVSSHPVLWLVAAAGCAVAWMAVSQALIIAAVWLSDRTVSIRRQLLTWAPLVNDGCELAAGVLIAGVIARLGLVLLVPALPLVMLLQRSFRRMQLDSRVDTRTGLLNAAAWRAEAQVQLARAQRTGSPLAVGIISLDLVNPDAADGDTDSYLARDAVLSAAASAACSGLRPCDLTGQISGREIALLLPATTAAEARAIAGRVRAAVAAHRVPAAAGGQPAHITAAIGMAATGTPAQDDLNELLAAADLALYRARQLEDDQVFLTDNRPDPGPDTEATAGNPAGSKDAQRRDRRELGRQLAAWRARAHLSQRELAHRTGYTRSTISSAEAGEPLSAQFWARADRALAAEGRLIAAHACIEAAASAARRRAAKLTWWTRAGAAGPGPAGATPDDGGITVDSACPGCGAPITISAQVTAVLPQHASARPAAREPGLAPMQGS